MKALDIRHLAPADIRAQLEEARRALVTAHEQVMTGKEKNSAQLKFLRADIARLETVLSSKA